MGYKPPDNPSFRTLNWAALVRKAWGKEWKKPEVVYKFSNGKEYVSSDRNGGPYQR